MVMWKVKVEGERRRTLLMSSEVEGCESVVTNSKLFGSCAKLVRTRITSIRLD